MSRSWEEQAAADQYPGRLFYGEPIAAIVCFDWSDYRAGGITYAVKFPGDSLNQAYFNVAPEQSANTYTVGGA